MATVGVLYRVVPNTKVPIRVLWLPALVAGLVLTGLTELLVYITPLLTGALSVFGGVAAVFAALAWLHLAFQVLLIGASWTRMRLDEAGDDQGRAARTRSGEPRRREDGLRSRSRAALIRRDDAGSYQCPLSGAPQVRAPGC